MSSEMPQEGQWYSHRSDGSFLVIGVHEEEGIIDVLDEYGEVDHLNFEEWESMLTLLCKLPSGGDVGMATDADRVRSFPVD